MDRRISFIQNEVNTIRNTIQTADFTLGEWKCNAERGDWPADTLLSIATLKGKIDTIRRSPDRHYRSNPR